LNSDSAELILDFKKPGEIKIWKCWYVAMVWKWYIRL